MLFPSLRLGYVVAARPLLERLVVARVVADFGTSVVAQAALTTLLATRGLERHVHRMRQVYADRLAALLAALEREMPAGTHWTTPTSGLLVWVTLPSRVDPDRLHHDALARGVAYSRGELLHFDGRGVGHLALSFAALDEDAISEGIARLGAVLRTQCASPRARAGTRGRRRTHAVG